MFYVGIGDKITTGLRTTNLDQGAFSRLQLRLFLFAFPLPFSLVEGCVQGVMMEGA